MLSSFVTSSQGRCSFASPRRLDEMQDAREQGVRLSRHADVDDAGVLQFVGEDVDDQFEYVVGEQTECAVDEYPGRPLQQDARDAEAKLLISAQFPIPTLGPVEHPCEAFKAQP